MKAGKITTLLHEKYPKAGDSKTVKVRHWNNLMDDLADHIPSDGVATLNTITEQTANAGVNVESVHFEDGAINHQVYASLTVPYYPDSAVQTLTTSQAGPNDAVNNTAYYTSVTTGAGGANASTLAAGYVTGQLKKIHMIVDAADLVITVADSDLSTITLNDVGDYVVLMWFDGATGWRVLENVGCVLAY